MLHNVIELNLVLRDPTAFIWCEVIVHTLSEVHQITH
jgi:hypothetical protein